MATGFHYAVPMSLDLPIVAELTLKSACTSATDDVNRWRGRCIEHYARIERGMGDMLRRLGYKTPVTFGERLKMMSAHLSEGESGKKAAPLLEELRPALSLRNMLVHGTGRVLVDCNKRWVWLYRFDGLKSGQPQVGAIEQSEAKTIEDILSKLGPSLCNQLSLMQPAKAVTK